MVFEDAKSQWGLLDLDQLKLWSHHYFAHLDGVIGTLKVKLSRLNFAATCQSAFTSHDANTAGMTYLRFATSFMVQGKGSIFAKDGLF